MLMFALLVPLLTVGVFALTNAELQTIATGYIADGTATAQCNTLPLSMVSFLFILTGISLLQPTFGVH